jgi:hypothetical protein
LLLSLTGNSAAKINEIQQVLKSEFDMTDMGKLHYFLGLEVKYLTGGGIFLSQSKYAKEVIQRNE